MDPNFLQRINRLPDYFQQLETCIPITQESLSLVPQFGIYLFLENGDPVYVGRTNRMKDRLKEHGRIGSKHNHASFAFQLAKELAVERGIDVSEMTRSELNEHEAFNVVFQNQRERVADMHIKYVEITDQIDQCLFEVYVAQVYQTRYNSFDNH